MNSPDVFQIFPSHARSNQSDEECRPAPAQQALRESTHSLQNGPFVTSLGPALIRCRLFRSKFGSVFGSARWLRPDNCA